MGKTTTTMYCVSRRNNSFVLSTPYHHETTATTDLSNDDAACEEFITSSAASLSSFSFTPLSSPPSDNTFSIHHRHHHTIMTQTQDQQQQQQQQTAPLAPFPNLPSQVSSTSSLSLNSNASSTASTLTSRLNPALSTACASINASTSLGLLASNYTNSLQNNNASNNTSWTHTTNNNYHNATTAAALASASIATGGTVPEFLYQLTKMLTDPNNEIIEWSTYSGNGRIEVHNPSRLESEVLSRYFRHSKYPSFQRQLNYFGFRKIAGKGKMSPCSYLNDASTLDIRSLLLMKRKGSEKEKSGGGGGSSNKAAESPSNEEDGKHTPALSSSTVQQAQAGSKRLNPGNDIQPVATVQPMFHSAHRNISFDSMAATVAKNIADVRTTQHLHHQQQQQVQQLEQHNEEVKEFKRTKLESSTSAPSGGQRGYRVAQGKGIRHSMNGFLRPSSGGSINNATVVSSSSAPTATTSESSYKTNEAWLPVPDTNASATAADAAAAMMAPPTTTTTAPLQFLDPNELGMSVTSATYLNQLKNNFVAVATADNAASSATAVGATTTAGGTTSSSGSAACAVDNIVDNTNTSSVSRVSSQTSFLGMLRRDDSLINLAMLPNLDTTTAVPGADDINSASNIDGGDGMTTFGFIDYNPSSLAER